MKARSSKKQSTATGLNHHIASSSASTTPLSPFQLRAQQSTQVKHAAQLQAMSTSQQPAQLQTQQHASTQNQQAVQLQHTSQESQEQEHAPTQLQSKTATTATADAPPKPNNTGLPDKLKAGIENLSGYSMDDVKVHRNSSKPAQLNAYAYAQGTDIHLGPGQEKHLPHEAWHVVQQKQGRVKATTQMKGVGVNDDVGLEREADVMGSWGAQGPSARSEAACKARSGHGRAAERPGGNEKAGRRSTVQRMRGSGQPRPVHVGPEFWANHTATDVDEALEKAIDRYTEEGKVVTSHLLGRDWVAPMLTAHAQARGSDATSVVMHMTYTAHRYDHQWQMDCFTIWQVTAGEITTTRSTDGQIFHVAGTAAGDWTMLGKTWINAEERYDEDYRE